MYLIDCDPEALELARENVAMLKEEELVGRSSDDEDSCLGVELIMAKVTYNPRKRSNKGVGGRGHNGGRDKKGKDRGERVDSTTIQNNILDYNITDNVNDGIPLCSKVVDTVITK